MSDRSKSMVLEIFRNRNLLSSQMLTVVQGFMKQWSVDGFRALIETNIIEESRMADLLSEVLKIPRLRSVPVLSVDPEIFDFIPYNLALETVVFPFELSGDSSSLKVVFADPSDNQVIQDISRLSGKEIRPFVGEKTEIIAAIQRHYPLVLQLPSFLSIHK